MRPEAVDRASKRLRPTVNAALGQLDDASGKKMRAGSVRSASQSAADASKNAADVICAGPKASLRKNGVISTTALLSPHRRERHLSVSHRCLAKPLPGDSGGLRLIGER
jgi:adenylylsulfate kinase-like enzyme